MILVSILISLMGPSVCALEGAISHEKNNDKTHCFFIVVVAVVALFDVDVQNIQLESLH